MTSAGVGGRSSGASTPATTAEQEWADYELANLAARDAYDRLAHCITCKTPTIVHFNRALVRCPECRKETN